MIPILFTLKLLYLEFKKNMFLFKYEALRNFLTMLLSSHIVFADQYYLLYYTEYSSHHQ